MTADGDLKDDVKLPEGEVGDKITKLFKEEEKDTRKFCLVLLKPNKSGTNPISSRHRSDCHG